MVKGIRRIGKSSLIRVGLNAHRVKAYAVLDARTLAAAGTEQFFEILAHGLSEMLSKTPRGLSDRIRRSLSMIEGIGLAGFEVRFTRREPQLIVRVIEALDNLAGESGEAIVLVFDEVQELASLPWLPRLLAHIYDYNHAIKLVLAGSEIGLLDRLLGKKNPKSPLYGRPYLEIEMPRLSHNKALEFLEKGFSELNLNWPTTNMEEAVEKLDGIPGWLTAYGYYAYTYRNHTKALKHVIEEGANTAKRELEKFLSNRKPARQRYLAILQCLAIHPMKWSQLKTCLETKIARTLNKAQFTRYLHELQNYSFIEKQEQTYRLADPLLAEALT